MGGEGEGGNRNQVMVCFKKRSGNRSSLRKGGDSKDSNHGRPTEQQIGQSASARNQIRWDTH